MDAIKNIFEKIKGLASIDRTFAELLISGSESLQLSCQKGKLEKFNSSQSQRAGIRVICEASQGYAWTENLSEESLLRTYKEALANARTMRGDNEEIPTARAATNFSSHSMNTEDLCIEEEIDVEKKIAMAKSLEASALAADARVQSVPYNSFTDAKSWMRVLNTEGVDKEFKQKYYTGFAYTLVKEGESSKTAYHTFFSRKFDQIDAEMVGRKSAQMALKHLGAVKLTTGNYPVVLASKVAQDLLGSLEEYFSAKSVFEKTSILAGKLGEIIASPLITLIDDPLKKTSMGVRPFDAEGCESQKTVLIEKGIAKNYLTNLEYAKKMNLPHTASASRAPASDMSIGASNLIVDKGHASLTDLLKRYPKVIYLTMIAGGMHSGFNETTGDFSLPGEGFLYENGVCVGPVDQFVFSGNILELLKGIEGLGDEYADESAAVQVPDLLVKELSFAGA